VASDRADGFPKDRVEFLEQLLRRARASAARSRDRGDAEATAAAVRHVQSVERQLEQARRAEAAEADRRRRPVTSHR
jgi:hypothetical protein